ncbi:MAG: NAD(P)H-dependent glycerol-3-phosphate dehydrogenase [Sneathiella sp.]
MLMKAKKTEGFMEKINVIGAGAWGTSLAIAMARSGQNVSLWCREESQATALNLAEENKKYLPGISFPKSLKATSNLQEIINAEIILNVVPAQHLRANLIALSTLITPQTALVICSKGIEKTSGKMMSEVVEEILPEQPYAILSGPNFAHEVAKGLPSATTLAASDKALGRSLVDAIGIPTFRPYFTDDVIGAQMGGAIKNVLAIACGVVVGAKLGENARAALITRGMAEILRLGERLGARAETLMGLSGFGDLVLTCSSTASRNFSLGNALGAGNRLEDFLKTRHSVTEGVHTAAAICELAAKHKIDMPICAAVNKILNEGASVTEVVEELLARPFRDEKLAGF